MDGEGISEPFFLQWNSTDSVMSFALRLSSSGSDPKEQVAVLTVRLIPLDELNPNL